MPIKAVFWWVIIVLLYCALLSIIHLFFWGLLFFYFFIFFYLFCAFANEMRAIKKHKKKKRKKKKITHTCILLLLLFVNAQLKLSLICLVYGVCALITVTVENVGFLHSPSMLLLCDATMCFVLSSVFFFLRFPVCTFSIPNKPTHKTLKKKTYNLTQRAILTTKHTVKFNFISQIYSKIFCVFAHASFFATLFVFLI